MDNLINFDDETKSPTVNKNEIARSKSPLPYPLLIPETDLDLNNPFDRLEYRLKYSNDPFECLETFNDINHGDPEAADNKLQDGSL